MAKCLKRMTDPDSGYKYSELGMVDWYGGGHPGIPEHGSGGGPCDHIEGRIRENIVYDRIHRSWHLNITKLHVSGNIRAYGTDPSGHSAKLAGSNPLFKEDFDWDGLGASPVLPKALEGYVMGGSLYISETALVNYITATCGASAAVKVVDEVPCVDVNKLLSILVKSTFDHFRGAHASNHSTPCMGGSGGGGGGSGSSAGDTGSGGAPAGSGAGALEAAASSTRFESEDPCSDPLLDKPLPSIPTDSSIDGSV